MDYETLYNTIIYRAKTRTYKVSGANHHIRPKSIGGNNKISNMVRLTHREHFICHRLLAKFTKGKDRKKMQNAMWFMSNQNKIKITARTYEIIRKEYMISIKNRTSPNKGRKFSESHCKSLSIAAKNKPQMTDETKRRMSEAQKGHPGYTLGSKQSEETKTKISEALKGRMLSTEHKTKLSESKMGEKNPMFGKKQNPEIIKKISIAMLGDKNHFYGKKHSAETKAKMRKAALNRRKKEIQ